ncbi:MAG TPA: hypothetical protein VG838_09100 [Opitutaceae bacterium]|nr:hypothetical protein [Opitutaceae bacterium]
MFSDFIHFSLVVILARQIQSRSALLAPFRDGARFFLSLGLTLFLVTWVDFLLYAAFGWGLPQQRLSWAALLVPVLYFSGLLAPRPPAPLAAAPPAEPDASPLRDARRWNYWFLGLAAFVLLRFYLGVTIDERGSIWCNFNFVDTPFHLSVANAFIESPRFPPMDLDAAPFPLKYHFLADFQVAYLVRLGLPALRAMWLMNLVSALVMIGSLWAVFERWLRLPPRWVLLAGCVFLFLNTSLVNLIHYLIFRPPYFHADNLYDGLLRYPYFNFEYSMGNLFEPQRGFLFTLPVVFLILEALFGNEAPSAGDDPRPDPRRLTLEACALVCLLPFAHIVSFAVLAACALPAAWRHRRWLWSHAVICLPLLAIGLLQLWYLAGYGPPTNTAYSGWDASQMLPLDEYEALPPFLRRVAFWFFANGDFFFWGLLFAALGWRLRAGAAARRLRQFLHQWRWYFAVCAGFFVLINFYRYSFAWGDSNKFVLFVNLGLTLVIVLGSAQWIGRRSRVLSYTLWWFFFLLSVAPPAYNLVRLLNAEHPMILLYTQNDREAAKWLRTALHPPEAILTGANNQIHFVTALAGRPTRAGIYSASNPYRQQGRGEIIRRIYEQGEFQLLSQLDTKYVCVSAHERRRYKVDPRWDELMKKGTAVVFHAGGGPEDNTSVFIFDANQLAGL